MRSLILSALASGICSFFTPKMLLVATAPFVVCLVVFWKLLAYFAGLGARLLAEFLQGLQGGWEVLNNAFVIFSVKFALWVVQSFCAVIFSYFAALVIVGFLTPFLAKSVAKTRGVTLPPPPSFSAQAKAFGGAFFNFVVICLVCLFALVLPFVNLIVFHIPFFYLFYKLMQIDIYANTKNKFEFDNLLNGEKDGAFRFICVLFYLIALVPFLGAFLQILCVLTLCHLSLQEPSKGFDKLSRRNLKLENAA